MIEKLPARGVFCSALAAFSSVSRCYLRFCSFWLPMWGFFLCVVVRLCPALCVVVRLCPALCVVVRLAVSVGFPIVKRIPFRVSERLLMVRLCFVCLFSVFDALYLVTAHKLDSSRHIARWSMSVMCLLLFGLRSP